ncbi:hypothetical protein EJ04DRAFT_517697 [Polyplosphaeria fusca]|uniref:Large ribosomal subunit protein bL28m n=1 Tax=Polyplosphaeria fusca TaxID=682080 RepID=A0A9P4QHS0_9PLEO|nr:hypothetical protein EJ04DRAFT_517697 [Polyplosphaeria fusca]
MPSTMAPPCRLLSTHICVPRPAGRTFCTSPPSLANRGSHLPKHVVPKGASIPTYPHGKSLLYKQSDRGLYGGQRIQFGNNVSRKTETKTRRKWYPNVLRKSLYSITLDKKIKLRVTSKVLRIIDREGGLDEYLLKESEKRLKELGPIGWNLRWTLMQTPQVIERFRNEAKELGISQEKIDEHWPVTPAWKLARLQKQQQLQEELVGLEQEEEREGGGLALESAELADEVIEEVIEERMDGTAKPTKAQESSKLY